MGQRFGIDKSIFDVSEVDRYLQKNKAGTPPNTTELVENKEQTIGGVKMPPNYVIEIDAKGNRSFTKITKDKPNVSYKQYGKEDQEFKDAKTKGLGLQDDDFLKVSSDNQYSIIKGSEKDTEYEVLHKTSAGTLKKDYDRIAKEHGFDTKKFYIERNKSNQKYEIKKYTKQKELDAKPKPDTEKMYKDSFGMIDFKRDAGGNWSEVFAKTTGGQRAEGRLENIIQEVNRKHEKGENKGKYVHDSIYTRQLRDRLSSIYGSVDKDYLNKVSKDIISRGTSNEEGVSQATDDFSINTEYGQNIDKMLDRYTLQTDADGVKSIKYAETRQDQISKQAPLANVLSLFKSVSKDKALMWSKDEQYIYDEQRDKDPSKYSTSDDTPDAPMAKFNVKPDADGNFKFVVNPEYLKYKDTLSDTERSQLIALNQSLDRDLNTLNEIAPNIMSKMTTSAKLGSPDILYNIGSNLLESLKKEE